eukprot:symbB.v1.2.022263.t1/scaffold1971.1/size94200/1
MEIRIIRASLRLGQHNCTVPPTGLCSECLRDCYITQECESECQVVCPHCGNLAPLTETPQLKRLRRSIASCAPPPAELSDWQILGIAKGSSRQQIQSAYRRRALDLHPDKPQGDRAAFEKLTEAHDRLLQGCDSHISHDHRERAQVVLRVMTDVKKDSWQERLRQEESATLEAMKALLQGRAPPVAKGTVQPICDEQVEKPQRVTIKGIITEVRRQGRASYKVRMSFNGMVIQSENTWSLEEAVHWRSLIIVMKEAGRNANKEDAWQIFGDAPAVFWYSMEAGSKFRHTTGNTMDIHRAIEYGRLLQEAAKAGRQTMLEEQKRQKMELKALRLSTKNKNAEDELLEVVNALLHPRAVRRRLRGKQPAPNAYGPLALPSPEAAPDPEQVPIERPVPMASSAKGPSRKRVGWFWQWMMPWS